MKLVYPQEKLEAMPGERPFSFSEQYVFGKFEAFCCRLNNITGLFDDIDKFSGFFEGRAECENSIISICSLLVFSFDIGKQYVRSKSNSIF